MLKPIRQLGHGLLRMVRAVAKPPVTTQRLSELLPLDDPRTCIQPLELRDWLCPCCAQRVETPRWPGPPSNPLDQQEIIDHLVPCLNEARLEGRPFLQPWEDLVLATVRWRLERWPNYRISNGSGDWICPHCLKPTGITRRNWDGTEAPWAWFLPEALKHLSECPRFGQQPLQPQSDLEVRATLGARDLYQLVFERAVNDPRFQVFDDAGTWIDPFSERPIPSINRRVLPWGTALQNAITNYLMSPQCPGTRCGWELSKSLDDLNVAVQRAAAERRESGRRIPSARMRPVDVQTGPFMRPRREKTTHEQAQADRQSARDAQLRLLPSKPPNIPGYRVSGFHEPCERLSGDMFHFFDAGLGRRGFVVGDVAGHGIAATLLMTSTMKSLGLRATGQREPVRILASVYRDLSKEMPVNRFVTIFFAVLHPPTGVLNYVRAGHVPALLLDGRGDVVELSGPGLAMGVSEPNAFESSLKEGQAVMPYNGALILFSWGVVEASNTQRRPFGLERIKDVVRANANRSSHGIVEALTQALREHSKGATQLDDWTIVVVKRGAL